MFRSEELLLCRALEHALQSTLLALYVASMPVYLVYTMHANTLHQYVLSAVPRFGNKREQYFSPACEKALKWWSICLALCIVCFGPCVGVVAAGTIFGAYGSHPHAAYRGQIIRSAASYVRGLSAISFTFAGDC